MRFGPVAKLYEKIACVHDLVKLIDTSVLIDLEYLEADDLPEEMAIAAVSLAELEVARRLKPSDVWFILVSADRRAGSRLRRAG